MADACARGYLMLDDVGRKQSSDSLKYGGRVDIKKEIKEINFTLSLTDATLRDTPNLGSNIRLADLLLTGEKKVNSTTTVGLGYDAGQQSVFASVALDTDIDYKPAHVKALWFQNGGQPVIRAEGDVTLSNDVSVWGTYTINAQESRHGMGKPRALAPATYVNLKERSGFMIDPFFAPVAASAIGARWALRDVTLEPSLDIGESAAYFGVSGLLRGREVRAAYAAKQRVGLLEARTDFGKFFAKAPLGAGSSHVMGVGPLCIGFIAEKTILL